MENTNYGFSKSADYGFEEAVEKTMEALKNKGFGVLADLDFEEKT